MHFIQTASMVYCMFENGTCTVYESECTYRVYDRSLREHRFISSYQYSN